jgi:signal transduction histidine kinase
MVLVHTEDISERREYEIGLQQSHEQAERARSQAQRERNLVVSLSRAAEAVQKALTPEEVYAVIGAEADRLGYRVVVQDVSDDHSYAGIRFATQDGSLETVTKRLLRLSLTAVRVPLAEDGFFTPLVRQGKSLYTERLADITSKAYPALKNVLHRTFLRLNIARAIFAPLVRDEYTSQWLAVCGNSLTEDDIPAITAFASQAATALEKARLLDELHHSRDRLRALAQKVVTAQEEERHRLSRALHDEAGQALTVVSITLQLLQQDLPSDPKSWREAASNDHLQDVLYQRLDEAIKTAAETMDHLRILAQDLRPPALDAVGLDQALRGLCRDFSRRTEVPVVFSSAGQRKLPGLLDDVNIAMYRTVQESLTNAVRHGEASEIQVQLVSDGKELQITVEDNGKGFDLAKLSETAEDERGVGLLGLQERLEMVEGQLEIDSAPGSGTRICAIVPIA